jgi:sigma-E factor negative regulatory protein RseA
MDTHKKIREHISALSDGALPTLDIELALAALHTVDGEQAWNTYHRIGDVLRAQATPDVSDAFSARLAARLALEPTPSLARRLPAAPGAASANASSANATSASNTSASASSSANDASNADGAPAKPVAAAAP